VQHTKNTTLILYPPGGYGTFLHWALTLVTSKNTSEANKTPFKKDGSSHKFKGTFLHFEDIPKYLESDDEELFVRSHGDIDWSRPFQKTVDDYKDNFKKIISIHPTENTLQLLLHNVMTKTYNKGDEDFFIDEPTDIYKIWTQLKNNTDDWEKREKISYILEAQNHYVEHYKINQNKKVLQITLDEFIKNTENIIYEILEFTNYNNSKNNLPKLNEWRKLQKYTDIDQTILQITNQIVSENMSYDWSHKNLSIIDEAKIQMNLRLQDINLKCYQMNVFPSSVLEMQPWIDKD
jgi:hypothetical protein